MGKCTFKGGIHPYDGKELSKDKPIKELFPAVGEMVFPLSQHIGAPHILRNPLPWLHSLNR